MLWGKVIFWLMRVEKVTIIVNIVNLKLTKYPVTSSSWGGSQLTRRPSDPTRRRIWSCSGGRRVRLIWRWRLSTSFESLILLICKWKHDKSSIQFLFELLSSQALFRVGLNNFHKKCSIVYSSKWISSSYFCSIFNVNIQIYSHLHVLLLHKSPIFRQALGS